MATKKPVYVPELFGELSISDDDRRWFVVHVKPRAEKKLAEYNYQHDIHYYLPQQDSERVYKYRKVMFTKPIFPGYVFVHCKLDDKLVLYRSGAIAHILKVPNEAELISELSQVYHGLDLGAELKEHAYLPEGTRVRITSGPFNGLIGYVSDTSDVSEIVLQVTFLRQAVAVSVTADQIEILRGK